MSADILGVNIPDRLLRIATDWHGGQESMSYALCSTGNLTPGSRRPLREFTTFFEDDGPECLTDSEWHVELWRKLADEFRHDLNGPHHPTYSHRPRERQDLEYACRTVCGILSELEAAYGLEQPACV